MRFSKRVLRVINTYFFPIFHSDKHLYFLKKEDLKQSNFIAQGTKRNTKSKVSRRKEILRLEWK